MSAERAETVLMWTCPQCGERFPPKSGLPNPPACDRCVRENTNPQLDKEYRDYIASLKALKRNSGIQRWNWSLVLSGVLTSVCFVCVLGYIVRTLQEQRRDYQRLVSGEVASVRPAPREKVAAVAQVRVVPAVPEKPVAPVPVKRKQEPVVVIPPVVSPVPPTDAPKRTYLTREVKEKLRGDATQEMVFNAVWEATGSVVDKAENSETVQFDEKATVCAKDMVFAARRGLVLFLVTGVFEDKDPQGKKREHEFFAIVYRNQEDGSYATHALSIDQKTVLMTSAAESYLRLANKELRELRIKQQD